MIYKRNILLYEWLTEKVRLVWILYDLFLLIYSNYKKKKNAYFKGLTSHYLKNSLPSQLFDLQSIQITRINSCKNYNIPFFYCILNSYGSATFDIFASLYPYFLLGSHILPWCFTVIFSQGTYIGILEVLLGCPFSKNSTPRVF